MRIEVFVDWYSVGHTEFLIGLAFFYLALRTVL